MYLIMDFYGGITGVFGQSRHYFIYFLSDIQLP